MRHQEKDGSGWSFTRLDTVGDVVDKMFDEMPECKVSSRLWTKHILNCFDVQFFDESGNKVRTGRVDVQLQLSVALDIWDNILPKVPNWKAGETQEETSDS